MEYNYILKIYCKKKKKEDKYFELQIKKYIVYNYL